jgi:peptidoglycan/LPS O-acetylase OafA/YrhL
VCGFLCISFAYRFHVLSDGELHLLLYLNTLARADPLVIGALGAYLWATRSAPRRVGLMAWPSVAVVIWLVGHHGDDRMLQLVGWTLMGVATTMIIVAIVNGWSGAKVLAWTPIRAVGRVSYGIYLWHVPVFVFVQTRGHTWALPTRLLVAYSATAVLVLFSWFCIERPFLALKPRPRTKVVPPAVVAVSDVSAAR